MALQVVVSPVAFGSPPRSQYARNQQYAIFPQKRPWDRRIVPSRCRKKLIADGR